MASESKLRGILPDRDQRIGELEAAQTKLQAAQIKLQHQMEAVDRTHEEVAASEVELRETLEDKDRKIGEL